MTTTNGGPAATQGAVPDQPQLTVVAQYIKDFSFENPNAPQSLNSRQEQPQIGIQINVGATPLSETDIEVVITLEGKAETGSTLLFRFDLEFAGVFRIRNVPQESSESGRDDRVPAATISVRPRDRCHRGTQWRLPATSARSGRFRRPLSAEDGTGAAGGSRSEQLSQHRSSGM